MLLLQVITDGLVFGSIYALGALGFSLIYSTTGTFHIAFGASLLVALYVATELGTSGGAGAFGLLVGLVLAMIIGAVIYVGFYRPMQARGRSRLIVFVASLGLSIAIEAGILMVFGAPQRNFSFGNLLEARDVLGQQVSLLGLVSVAVAVIALFALRQLLGRSSFGRKVQGISMNPELAETIGIRTRRVIVTVFAIGSGLGFLALFAYSANNAVTSDIGTAYTLVVAVAVIAGGVGSLLGSYLIAMLFGLIQALAGVYLSGQWTLVAVYGGFIVLIMARPDGLFRGLQRA
jgi:branched-chain amino acid transport system permease protein